MNILDNDTIVALATPSGGAIGVIRLSGPSAIAIANNLFCATRKDCTLLEAKGNTLQYGVLRSKDGEELDDVVVMAEVKTRRVALDCDTRVFPEEAVDAQKQRRYRRIASCYLMEHYPLKAIRFDAVGVTIRGGHIAEIEHQYNAFDWQVS